MSEAVLSQLEPGWRFPLKKFFHESGMNRRTGLSSAGPLGPGLVPPGPKGGCRGSGGGGSGAAADPGLAPRGSGDLPGRPPCELRDMAGAKSGPGRSPAPLGSPTGGNCRGVPRAAGAGEGRAGRRAPTGSGAVAQHLRRPGALTCGGTTAFARGGGSFRPAGREWRDRPGQERRELSRDRGAVPAGRGRAWQEGWRRDSQHDRMGQVRRDRRGTGIPTCLLSCSGRVVLEHIAHGCVPTLLEYLW